MELQGYCKAQKLAGGGRAPQRCAVNQFPPTDGDFLSPNPEDNDPQAGFALNGYLRLIELQNQALRKLAAQLDPPAPPDTSPAPSDASA